MMTQEEKLAWKQEAKAEQVVIHQGELNADFFYIIEEGRFRVSLSVSAL